MKGSHLRAGQNNTTPYKPRKTEILMTTISNEEIDQLRTQSKTELEKLYEHDLLASTNREIHNLATTIDFLSEMDIKDAMKEVYFLIYKRLTLFLGSLNPETREKITPEIKKIARCISKNQTKLALGPLSKRVSLSRAHRTIFNHFAEAFQTFNFATLTASAHLEATNIAVPIAEPKATVMALFLSLQCLYKGDMRLIRESTAPDRTQLAKNASATRSQQYTPAKTQTCLLLRELAPQGGWTSKPHAAKVIAPILEEFLIQNKISTPNRFTLGNVQRRIRDWLNKETDVESTYFENCSTPKI